MDPYENLANAIVKSAAKDYMATYKKYLKRPNKPGNYEDVMREEKFFRSGWYSILTNVDGEYLIEKMKATVKQELNGRAY